MTFKYLTEKYEPPKQGAPICSGASRRHYLAPGYIKPGLTLEKYQLIIHTDNNMKVNNIY